MFIGMDGGGTKSAFVLIDQTGRIRASHHGGSAYYLEVGMQGVRALVNDGIKALLQSGGVSAANLDFAYFGLPVHGEDGRTAELDLLPASTLNAAKYACGNDMVCGWAGSLACEDGINVVAGTGSICYGEFLGRSARSGGWGELFSDEGSAFWIARSGFTLFSRMSDGRAAKGPLYDLFREKLASRPDLELTAVVLDELAQGRSKVAAWSKLVHSAAERGDTQAVEIFSSAARELAELVIAVRQSLNVPADATLPVSYSGGIFSTGALVTEPFQAALRASGGNYKLAAPRFPPVIGAALYAAKCAGKPLAEAALKQLGAETLRVG